MASENQGLGKTVFDHDERIISLEKNLSKSNEMLGTNIQASIARNYNTIQQNVTLEGLYLALVIDTFDIWKQNRVRFFTPILHNPVTVKIRQLPWAFPISTFGGFDDSGANWVPPAGSCVCLIFEHGNRKAAYYLLLNYQFLSFLFRLKTESFYLIILLLNY